MNVAIYAFDLLYLNGQSLLLEPLKERRRLLFSSFQETPGKFRFATHTEANDTEAIQDLLMKAIEDKCEGLMVKSLDKNATYEPAQRSMKWLKVKKDYMAGLTDSLDLVPIGAYIGQGKRTGMFGAYLLACFDEEQEEFQAICKIGTGFSEERLAELTAFFKGHTLQEPKSYFRFPEHANKPDVWLDPVSVWEVMAADLSLSPIYKAAVGLADPSRGIALRFPRLLRVREDKDPEQATTAQQVADMYLSQSVVSSSAGARGAF